MKKQSKKSSMCNTYQVVPNNCADMFRSVHNHIELTLKKYLISTKEHLRTLSQIYAGNECGSRYAYPHKECSAIETR